MLLALSGLFLVNLSQSPDGFVIASALCASPGLYLLISGAVTRGILLARS